MTDSDSFERQLTHAEIDERAEQREDLEDERDKLLVSVEDRRKEIRAFVAKRKKLEMQIRDLRREIRSGTVLEPKQVKLAFPPAPVLAGEATSLLERIFPVPRDAEALHSMLSVVFQGRLVPSIEKCEKWKPSSGIFFAVSQWARSELAHMNAKDLARSHPELSLPVRTPMPVALSEVRQLLSLAEKKRGGAKPPAAKASKRKPGPAPRGRK